MHMANEAISQESESAQSTRPASRRRKVTNLSVQLAADFDLWPVVEPWERDLILPRLARWLDGALTDRRAQKESGHDE
jgi:hypothetical protein